MSFSVPSDAAVILPYASTVKEVFVYEPAVTAVLAKLISIEPSATAGFVFGNVCVKSKVVESIPNEAIAPAPV